MGLIACGTTALLLTLCRVTAVQLTAEQPAAIGAVVIRASSTTPATTATSTTTSTVVPSTTTSTTTATRTYASSAELPDGGPIPVQGTGQYHVVPGTSGVVGDGPLRSYVVEVEDGVQVDERAFADVVQQTLEDPRGWTRGGEVAFQRVAGGPASLRVRLTSQNTARAVCGFEIPVDVSCRVGGVVHLSAARWVRGAVAYDGDLVNYRRYVITHEVGHALGHGHRPCEVDGGLAPVMMQQTFSTSNDEIGRITAGVPQGALIPSDGRTCLPNPWPFP